MFQNLTGWHFVILLVIILLLFGAPRLPALARSLGQSFRILKGEVKQAKDDDSAAPAADGAVANVSDTSAASPGSTPPAAAPAPDAPQQSTPRPSDPGDPTSRP